MTNINVKITVDEFVKKIIGGERDFRRIELEQGIELQKHEGFSELYRELSREPAEHPLILSYANLSGIQVNGSLPLDYCIARHTNFSNSRLSYVSFGHGDLTDASFNYANLSYIRFAYAKLIGAKFESAEIWESAGQENFNGTDVEKARLFNCMIMRSDLTGIKNLDKAINLPDAMFCYVLADKKDKKIIINAWKKHKKQLFARGYAPCRG